MADRFKRHQPEICLISTPWLSIAMPSIQIGSLKAYIEENLGPKVQCIHSHILYADAMGFDVYDALCDKGNRYELAELVFAHAASGPNRPRCVSYLKKILERDGRCIGTELPSVETFSKKISSCTNRIVSMIDPSVKLIGISVSIFSVSAAIYIAEKIKKRFPKIPVVIGGAILDATLGTTLVDQYPQFDYFIYGEGEPSLLALIEAIRRKELYPSSISALYWRGRADKPAIAQMADINRLPIPDYDDYFEQLKLLKTDIAASVGLPVEFSRGCWWSCVGQKGEKGCSFCAFNHQWRGYRLKSPKKIAEDIHTHSQRYDILDFYVVDNIPPRSKAKLAGLYRNIHNSSLDVALTLQMHSHLAKPELDATCFSGRDHIQLGIEALDDNILNVIHKGTSVFAHLRAMKYFLKQGIKAYGNLIVGHPGCKEVDILKSAELIDAICHFPPLFLSNFKLERGSNIFRNPEKYGICDIRPKPVFKVIFGKSIANKCAYYFDFKTKGRSLNGAWKVLCERLRGWQERHAGRPLKVADSPLTWRRACNGIQITDCRNGQKKVYVLNEMQSRVFEIFDEGASIEEATKRTGCDELSIALCLKTLAKMKIVYFDGVSALSLPFNCR